MNEPLNERIGRLAANRESGASEILDEVLAVFRDALSAGVPLLPIARAVCRAQPSMAPVWNAALELLMDRPDERLDRYAARIAKAPAALTRIARGYFTADGHGPLRLVTISFSRTVATVLEEVVAARELHVACSESRPALEGHRLASRLAAAGVSVTFFSDAAIGHALGGADGVVFGADAVGPVWFLNKSGTRMLAAAAAQQGVPVQVLATRDKFISHALAARLTPREGSPEEVWEAPPPGVVVRNPYFEATPLESVATLLTDVGVLDPTSAADVCEGVGRHQPSDLVAKL